MAVSNITSFLRDPNQFGIFVSSALAAVAASSCGTIPAVMALAAAAFSSYLVPAEPLQPVVVVIKQNEPSFLERRLRELNIKTIAAEMSPESSCPQVIIFENMAVFPSAKKTPDGESTIHLSYLFGIQSKDIPNQYKITGIDDPRLESDAFLQEVADYTKKLCGYKKTTLTAEDKTALIRFLLDIRDPELSQKGKEFILRHEMAHILHEHTHGSGNLMGKITDWIVSKKFLAICVGIVALALISALVLSVPHLFVIAGAIGLFLLALTIPPALKIIHSRNCEMEADLTAAQLGPNSIPGGIYYMENGQKYGKYARNKIPALKWHYDSEGNHRLRKLTHPSFTDRIAYLKSYLPK